MPLYAFSLFRLYREDGQIYNNARNGSIEAANSYEAKGLLMDWVKFFPEVATPWHISAWDVSNPIVANEVAEFVACKERERWEESEAESARKAESEQPGEPPPSAEPTNVPIKPNFFRRMFGLWS